MAKPKIRFNGYTEDWEQRKLGDWGDFYYGRSCPKWSVTEDATIPCIRYGELYTKFGAKIDRVYSYTNMPPENLRFSKGTEVLIPRVGEDPMDYNHCTWLSMQGVAIGEMISVFNTDNNPLFTATMFNATLQNEFAMRVEGGSVTNLYFEKLKNIDVSFPSIPEQEKIAAYFESLDHLITLHQRKCEQTKTLKKYMLQKMFPQDGEKVPQIRFEGFTEDWEQRKLGKLYQRNTERNENLIGYDKTISVATMSYKDDGNGASESSLSTYKVLRVGDIAFEGHTNKQFRFGRFVVNDIGTGIMSPRFSTLRPLNEMPVNFWKQYIHSESVMRRILVNSTKAGTMMNELVIPEFLNQTIMVPSENEQAVIGQYFTNLDHLITLHQRKCDELKEVKKFMLQNMFV